MMSQSEKSIPELLSCCFVVVDKPRGPSSHEVSAFTRKILGVEKSGHAGTLDPQVSGVLVVGLGKATRLLPYVTTKDKSYVCLMRTGRAMDERELLGLFKRFTGEITQTPPKQSAVAKRPRKRKVYNIKLIQIKSSEVLFEVHCEAGTYIRVLVSDFGRFCGGAKMLELRRISVGNIKEASAHTLQAISDAMWLSQEKQVEKRIRGMLLAPETALQLPKIIVRDSAVEAVCAGSPLFAPGVSAMPEAFEEGKNLAVLTEKFELVGVACAAISSEMAAKMKQGIVAMPKTIVMKRGTYKKGW